MININTNYAGYNTRGFTEECRERATSEIGYRLPCVLYDQNMSIEIILNKKIDPEEIDNHAYDQMTEELTQVEKDINPLNKVNVYIQLQGQALRGKIQSNLMVFCPVFSLFAGLLYFKISPSHEDKISRFTDINERISLLMYQVLFITGFYYVGNGYMDYKRKKSLLDAENNSNEHIVTEKYYRALGPMPEDKKILNKAYEYIDKTKLFINRVAFEKMMHKFKHPPTEIMLIKMIITMAKLSPLLFNKEDLIKLNNNIIKGEISKNDKIYNNGKI